MTGKGSRQRPSNKERFDREFDRIFKKKDKDGCAKTKGVTEKKIR